jgi:hypothetical protein
LTFLNIPHLERQGPDIQSKVDELEALNQSIRYRDKAAAYLEKMMKILRNEKYLKVEKRAMNIWDLFKKIISDEEHEGGKNTHIFVNVSTGSKVSSIAGTMACMIWKGTPYYAHIEYNDKTDPEDGLPDEDVNEIDEIPVYSINKPRDESLAILKILSNAKGPQKMKKNRLLEQLEEAGLVDKNLSGAAKHSRIKGLLNPIRQSVGRSRIQRETK